MRGLHALAAILAVFPTPTFAQTNNVSNYKQFDDGWGVVQTDGYCLATREYEGDDRVTFSYLPASDTAYIHFTDPDSTSLTDQQEVKLYITFVTNGDPDDGWGQKDFTVFREEGTDTAFVTQLEGRILLADVAQSTNVAFSIDEDGERMVGNYALDGSARAMATLKECSFKAAGLNPKDPFLN